MPKVIVSDKSSTHSFEIEENRTILDLSKQENIDIEGSCDGSMACSTCHILIDKDWINKLPAPCIDEKEMLSLLTNYNKNSRLGCQIIITKKLNGLKFSIPRDN